MTIRSFAPGALASNRAADMFVSMRRELDDLQRQLATGKKAETFAGLGFERRSSLDVRGKMAMIAGYQTTIEGGHLRLKVMAQVAERLDGMARETRSDLLGTGFDIGADGRGTAQNLAEQRLREALDHLNRDVNGRFLFAGRSPEAPPVEEYDRIMNGDSVAGEDGLSRLIVERMAAELGPDGMGRLSSTTDVPVFPSTSPYSVRLTGNGTGLPFGFEIVSTSARSSVITGGNAVGSPEQASLTVSGVPAENDTVSVVVRDKSGATHTIQLTAKTTVNPGDRGVFQIGASEGVTVSGPNGLRVALDRAIQEKASAVLKPLAAIAAAEDFFDGSLNNPPVRVLASPRLTPSLQAGNTVRLTGDVSTFGFEILPATTNTGGAITTTFSGATPEYASFQLTAVPADGDKIVLQLQDRNGNPHTVELTARTTPTGPNDFQIGADEPSTISDANGIMAAMTRALDIKAAEVLGADEATTLAVSDRRNTLIWYKGDDAAVPSARDTVPLRIDTSQTVGTGARANEPAIKSFLAQFAVLAEARFTNTPVERERYENLTSRLRDNLSPPYGQPRVEELATDFGAALATMEGAKDRHRVAANMLQDTLDKVEQASTEETAATMLNLQTRLQASYQTTSMLSRLSLVNFL